MDNDHYFQPQPRSPSRSQTIQARLRGVDWTFATDRGVFSPERIDPGTRLLIESMVVQPGARVLDLGAGYGPIGLVAARLAGPEGRVLLVEVNERALELARRNAEAAGLANVAFAAELDPAERFDLVLTNPPIRAGYKVVMPLLEQGAAALASGGALWLVGYKHLGVSTLEKKLAELLGPIETVAKKGGYRVLVGRRADDADA